VDDDDDFRRFIIRVLEEGGPGRIDQASSAAEARERLEQRPYDVVITDLSMPEEGGLSLMQWSHESCSGPAWIVLTGHGTLDVAVRALQLGAFDFLEKPLAGVEPLRNSVRNALAHQRLVAERARLHAELEESNARLREHVEELERADRLLREQAESVRADLHRAGIIQRALLPQTAPPLTGVHVHALYRPSQSVGGDLYDVVRLDDRHAVLLVADAAGHGLSAAMLAVLFRCHLVLSDPDTGAPLPPREMLRAANRALCEEFAAPGLFLTAACCLLDTVRRTATVASAGHPPLLLLRECGDVERIFHTGPALGLYREADYAQQELTLVPGDRVLFYSDGVYDRLPGAGGSASERIVKAVEAAGRKGTEALALLMLDATPGASQLDNGTLSPLPAPAPLQTRCGILMGSDDQRTTFSIQGRAAWIGSAAFHAECVTALDSGRGVMIDLTLCEHLDSTFLGAFHELAERAEVADVEFRLQGVTPAVEDLFLELGMKGLMERIVPCMLPLPTRMIPLNADADREARARITLHAHEVLAGLSDRNRREFDPLLALLRREIAAASH
jgi:serine phosphatase RsbU (regulator of sigma subunit)/anti-anti-sigma regulatory factor